MNNKLLEYNFFESPQYNIITVYKIATLLL